MNRKTALGVCMLAGYHDDSASFTRAYVENRISYGAANAEWNRGVRLKRAGAPCSCASCKGAAVNQTGI